VKAGSVLEEDDQRGLAHFVEHMAFNGTKRFPKFQIVDYLENAGMTFGADVNAYTSFDATVYQLTVPTDDSDFVKNGLEILSDWAADVTFDAVEVDKERGVVLEEWRRGRGAAARIEDRQFPVVFQGSRYAERLPIGLPDVLRTAKREALLRFYKDWYRPESMAVIAVGDLQSAIVELEIQRRFADLKNNVLRTAYQYGDKVANLIDVEASTRRVSRANIGAAAVRFLNDKNTLIGVLRPKSQP
jgi:zinc protease